MGGDNDLRFSFNGKAKNGTKSEEFDDAMHEAGAVECLKCKVKIGEGIRGKAITVCKECIEYFCDDHIYRHPNCCNGK